MFYLSYSAIHSVLDNGDIIPHCPRQIYWTVINKKFNVHKKVFDIGNYFETKAIGSGRSGSKLESLRHHTVSGRKPIVQTRLDKQVMTFKKKAEELKVQYRLSNIQVPYYFRWPENPNIIISTHPDIFLTPIVSKVFGGTVISTIDLKTTGSLESDYGSHQWAEPEKRDLLQGILYGYGISKCLDFDLNDKLNPTNNLRELFNNKTMEYLKSDAYIFYYWIFSYNEPLDNKLVPVIINKEKINFMNESIRKTIKIYRDMHRLGYPTNPDYDLCKTCPIKNMCKDAINEQPV